VKPEIWADERIGRISRDARLLFVGLITMADDHGRLRALPLGILGHVFPHDLDAPRKLDRWLGELEAVGLIVSYRQAGMPYIALPNWTKHQRVNRASNSELPAPPIANDFHGTVRELRAGIQ
jgi:hypothetical protein